jgi:branched-chain amino acid transport system substrate-binding protein
MQPQLIKMREGKPDAYILWSTANPAPTIILRTAKELGIKETFYVAHGNGSIPFLKQTGPAGEGAVAPAFPILGPEVLSDRDPRKPVVVAFQKDYVAKWNEPADQSASYAYDALLVVQAAAKAVKGPISRDNLRDAIENLKDACGTVGCRNLSATDHRGLDKDIMVMMQIKGGRWVAFD